MRKLYLHIGHGKTGSSYIQSSLAGSITAIEQTGISYPVQDHMLAAKEGRVSSGNGVLFLDSLNNGAKLDCRQPSVLYSAERLFQEFTKPDIQEKFRAFLQRGEFDCAEVLLFVRDPVSNACSSYQQWVKRGGYTADIVRGLRSFNRPQQVNEVLDFFETVPEVSVTVKNYSACAGNLLQVVEHWLDLTPGVLATPPIKNVNRPLSIGEAELQRHLNRHFRGPGYLLAEQFALRLPEIDAEQIRPSLKVQHSLWERLSPEIERVNARIPASARYDRERDIRDGSAKINGPYTFTAAHLSIVAESIAQEARRGDRLQSRLDEVLPLLESARSEAALLREANEANERPRWFNPIRRLLGFTLL
ncbi:hypothetical protein [Chelativorans salis]|uniref:Sulfotransferase family protein n=1 Tax=Chelativorans salis TaxID=2978478 RepID=A0ABT2LLK6_9HYPH|nr:hypothetical protein [Chelativorans sp. EGI FJ00035]MCT7375475.1 hypothetical protein [Chelativorans sp. EGI FJ00035]